MFGPTVIVPRHTGEEHRIEKREKKKNKKTSCHGTSCKRIDLCVSFVVYTFHSYIYNEGHTSRFQQSQ